jgi:hypothetical protein
MSQQRLLVLLLPAIWGMFATWIFWWLFGPVVGSVLIVSNSPVEALLRNGWTTDQVRPYLYGVVTVLPALVYGLIFGLPLGLVAKRPIIVTWVVFVVAFVVTLGARILVAELGFARLVENLTDSLSWLTFLATLVFLFIGSRVRSAYARRAAA